MIAQLLPDPAYCLLYMDESGEEITDTYHDSLERHSTKPNGNLMSNLMSGICPNRRLS